MRTMPRSWSRLQVGQGAYSAACFFSAGRTATRKLLGIEFPPVGARLGEEEAAARAVEDLGMLDARRQRALVAQRPRRLQQATPRAGDHLVGRRQMLEAMVGDRPHALGHRLVLHVDVVDAGIGRVGVLGLAVDPPVVRFAVLETPAAMPVGRVRLVAMAEAEAGKRRAVLLDRADGPLAPVPRQMDEHRVRVVHRHPGADIDLMRKLALRRLRPERQEEIGEAPIGPAVAGLAVRGIGRAPIGIGHIVFGRAVLHRVAQEIVLRELVGIDVAAMQEAEMRGVDVAFERLHEVARALAEDDRQFALGQQRRLDLGQRRRLGGAPM